MLAKGVILAAGRGARLSPMTPFVPKEMLPISAFPAVHHTLYELAEAGIREVMIVVSSGKSALVSYLTEPIVPKGGLATQLTAERDALLSRIRISFAEQKSLKGTADAILLAQEFMGDSPLVVAYPDDLLTVCGILSDGIDATRALVREAERTQGSAILVTRISGNEARNYGVVNCHLEEESFRVDSLIEKPQDYTADVAYALIGRMILTPKAVASIRSFALTDESGIVPVLSAEGMMGALTAVEYDGKRYDLGSHEGYYSAVRELDARYFRA